VGGGKGDERKIEKTCSTNANSREKCTSRQKANQEPLEGEGERGQSCVAKERRRAGHESKEAFEGPTHRGGKGGPHLGRRKANGRPNFSARTQRCQGGSGTQKNKEETLMGPRHEYPPMRSPTPKPDHQHSLRNGVSTWKKEGSSRRKTWPQKGKKYLKTNLLTKQQEREEKKEKKEERQKKGTSLKRAVRVWGT